MSGNVVGSYDFIDRYQDLITSTIINRQWFLYVHCWKINHSFVRALQKGRKASLYTTTYRISMWTEKIPWTRQVLMHRTVSSFPYNLGSSYLIYILILDGIYQYFPLSYLNFSFIVLRYLPEKIANNLQGASET